jgi:serine/threonine-protein kinase HipA
VTIPIWSDFGQVADIVPDVDGGHLRYTPAWLSNPASWPISLSMPLTQAEHVADRLLPWLMNLLPEGEPGIMARRRLGMAADDVIGQIRALGRDLSGGLSFAPPSPGRYLPIGDADDLGRIINELPARPFLIGDEGVAMSLAGAQEKLPVAIFDDQLFIPADGAASTHILKPDNHRLHGSVQNEALCMVLAARCRLPVAPVTTGIAGDRTYLMVERFDRTRSGDLVLRRHQEDFCQALGRTPGEKYENNQTGRPGPSLQMLFDLVRQHMTAADTIRLLDAVIFNIAIGNVDSHAKNYSLFLDQQPPRLTPLYDLMSGIEWPGITRNHAQRVGDERVGAHITGKHWRRFAQAAGLAVPATLKRVKAVCHQVTKHIGASATQVAVMPAGPGPMLDLFANSIAERAALVARNATRLDDL